MQRLAEGDHIGLGGVIDRHAGAGQEAGHRSHVENAALAALERVDEREGEIGQRAHVEVDHRELRGTVEPVRGSDEAKTGIVDDRIRLQSAPGERLADLLRRIDGRDVQRQNGRPGAALGRNGVRKRNKLGLAPGNQHHLVAFGGELMRERRPDPGRRAGDQRDGAFLRAHAGSVPRRLATPCPSSIRSRDEMPRRSAARQIRLLSKSLIRPSA